jgi:hypothetical protein
VNRKDFREFKFYIIGKRERINLRIRTKLIYPEVLYSIIIIDGFIVLNKTGFLNIVRKKAKEGYIYKYYEKKGILLL